MRVFRNSDAILIFFMGIRLFGVAFVKIIYGRVPPSLLSAMSNTYPLIIKSMPRLCFLLTAALLLVSGSAAAKSHADAMTDSLINSNKVIFLPGQEEPVSKDSIANVITRFYIDQFRNFQDPAAPYFLFMSRDASLAMGIGGCVRMRGWYQVRRMDAGFRRVRAIRLETERACASGGHLPHAHIPQSRGGSQP